MEEEYRVFTFYNDKGGAVYIPTGLTFEGVKGHILYYHLGSHFAKPSPHHRFVLKDENEEEITNANQIYDISDPFIYLCEVLADIEPATRKPRTRREPAPGPNAYVADLRGNAHLADLHHEGRDWNDRYTTDGTYGGEEESQLSRNEELSKMKVGDKDVGQIVLDKTYIIEHFGEKIEGLEREITVFVKCRGRGRTKVLEVKQYCPDFNMVTFRNNFAKAFRVRTKSVPEFYDSNGVEITDVNDFEEEDMISVFVEGLHDRDEFMEELNDTVMEAKEAREEEEAKEHEENMRILADIRAEQKRNESKLLERMTEKQKALYHKTKELRNKTKECSVCFDELPANEMLVLNECYHTFCLDCLGGFIGAQINNLNVQVDKNGDVGIYCPWKGCKRMLDLTDVQRCVSEDQFERLDTILRDIAIARLGDIVWCRTTDCPSAMVQYEDSNMYICYVCKGTICIECEIPYHSGMSCEEFENGNIFDNPNTKKCPSCSAPIEKNGGCNHMACAVCNYHFCWICEEEFEGYQHFRANGCPMYST